MAKCKSKVGGVGGTACTQLVVLMTALAIGVTSWQLIGIPAPARPLRSLTETQAHSTAAMPFEVVIEGGQQRALIDVSFGHFQGFIWLPKTTCLGYWGVAGFPSPFQAPNASRQAVFGSPASKAQEAPVMDRGDGQADRASRLLRFGKIFQGPLQEEVVPPWYLQGGWM